MSGTKYYEAPIILRLISKVPRLTSRYNDVSFLASEVEEESWNYVLGATLASLTILGILVIWSMIVSYSSWSRRYYGQGLWRTIRETKCFCFWIRFRQGRYLRSIWFGDYDEDDDEDMFLEEPARMNSKQNHTEQQGQQQGRRHLEEDGYTDEETNNNETSSQMDDRQEQLQKISRTIKYKRTCFLLVGTSTLLMTFIMIAGLALLQTSNKQMLTEAEFVAKSARNGRNECLHAIESGDEIISWKDDMVQQLMDNDDNGSCGNENDAHETIGKLFDAIGASDIDTSLPFIKDLALDLDDASELMDDAHGELRSLTTWFWWAMISVLLLNILIFLLMLAVLRTLLSRTTTTTPISSLSRFSQPIITTFYILLSIVWISTSAFALAFVVTSDFCASETPHYVRSNVEMNDILRRANSDSTMLRVLNQRRYLKDSLVVSAALNYASDCSTETPYPTAFLQTLESNLHTTITQTTSVQLIGLPCSLNVDFASFHLRQIVSSMRTLHSHLSDANIALDCQILRQSYSRAVHTASCDDASIGLILTFSSMLWICFGSMILVGLLKVVMWRTEEDVLEERERWNKIREQRRHHMGEEGGQDINEEESQMDNKIRETIEIGTEGDDDDDNDVFNQSIEIRSLDDDRQKENFFDTSHDDDEFVDSEVNESRSSYSHTTSSATTTQTGNRRKDKKGK